MIPNIQIQGEPDAHPEKPVYDAGQLAAGKIDLDKLAVKDHHVKVFDLMDPDECKEYGRLYKDLCSKAKAGKIFIVANTREVLTRPDRSTGWFKYLEWTEFDTSNILGA